MSFCSTHCTAVIFERKTFGDAIMDRKREILNFIRDQRLDEVEELKEKELQLLEQQLYLPHKICLC